ncbi:hypothetical protein BV898_10920 [Hypsibius exemplaris]|uniref:Fringe-like glycosyltransferase domain-containing protein n=1 Tax=Hypsibius exemplaris TaxID=2072580 RepID=A0A1W0WI51_HYPEX|nr:hypothetical protein BV898_10920 [Hypsibius exemplaris]
MPNENHHVGWSCGLKLKSALSWWRASYFLLIVSSFCVTTVLVVLHGLEHCCTGKFRAEFAHVTPNFLFITVKTTAANHRTRLKILLETWIKCALRVKTSSNELPVVSAIAVVSDGPLQLDLAKNVYCQAEHDSVLLQSNNTKRQFLTWQCLPALNSSQVFFNNASFCGVGHYAQSLMCKLQEELRMYFKIPKTLPAWFCHFDDDTYVNIPNLIVSLAALGDPHTLPIFVGKSPPRLTDGYNTSLHLLRWKNHHRMVTFANGPAYCMSHRLMRKMEKTILQDRHVFNLAKFARRVDPGVGDDVILSIYISEILGVPLTQMPTMYSTLDNLTLLRKTDIDHAVTLSHSSNNTFILPDSKLTSPDIISQFRLLNTFVGAHDWQRNFINLFNKTFPKMNS